MDVIYLSVAILAQAILAQGVWLKKYIQRCGVALWGVCFALFDQRLVRSHLQ